MILRYSNSQSIEGSSCVQVIGEIDINSARYFKDQLMEFGASDSCKHNLLIDCSQLQYMDSQGLNVLACLYNKLKVEQKKITLINTNSNIKKLLRIAELDRVISIEN